MVREARGRRLCLLLARLLVRISGGITNGSSRDGGGGPLVVFGANVERGVSPEAWSWSAAVEGGPGWERFDMIMTVLFLLFL